MMKALLRKCQFPLMLAFGSMPIVLILLAMVAPLLLIYGWIFSGVYVILTVVSLLIRGKWRLLYGVAAFLVIIALGVLLMAWAHSYFLLIVPGLYGVLLLSSLRMAGWSWEQEIHGFWYWAGIVVHIGAQMALILTRMMKNPILEPAAIGMTVSFFAFAVLAALSMNRSCLTSAAMGRQNISMSMRRKNILLVLGFLALALLIALIPSVTSVIKDVFTWLFLLIAWLINSLPQPGRTTEGSIAAETSEPVQIVAENTESSQLSQILNIIFYVLALVVTVVVLAFAVHYLVKKLWVLLRLLWSRVNRYLSAVSEDYEDEITDTRDSVDKERLRSCRGIRRISMADERNLPPDQRIRRRYQRLMKKHPEWTAGSTARENLPVGAASLYERARYSQHPLTDEDAGEFSAGVKRV